MREFKAILLTSTLLLLAGAFERVYAADEGGKRDTVSALVLYGDEVLPNAIGSMSDEAIFKLHDSLSKDPNASHRLLSNIGMFLNVKRMSRDEVVYLLDSLFEADNVDYSIINQINIYITEHPLKAEEEMIAEEGMPFPAHDIYEVWNTSKPHPYPISLFQLDTTSEIKLSSRKFGDYASPLEKIVITSKYGYRDGRSHRGYDLDLQVWDEVSSTFDGQVRFAAFYGGYGRVVVVRHYNGLETVYAHLHRYKCKVGDFVKAGDVIGLGGSSGHSTGSHLHFEVRYKGIALDPGTFIDFKKKKLVSKSIHLRKGKWGYASIPVGIPFHTVVRGDSLYEIAAKYGTSINRLCEINNIRRNGYLRVGQRIRII
jgi:murein DD-endopeptidase MepM/ murein hydrolase activator NlpD